MEGFVDADWISSGPKVLYWICIQIERRCHKLGVQKTTNRGALLNRGRIHSVDGGRKRSYIFTKIHYEFFCCLRLELGSSDPDRIQLMCDNRGAQLLAWNYIFYARSKHVYLM